MPQAWAVDGRLVAMLISGLVNSREGLMRESEE